MKESTGYRERALETPPQLRRHSSALKSEFLYNGKPICPWWNCRLLGMTRARADPSAGGPPFLGRAACAPAAGWAGHSEFFDFSSTYSAIEFGWLSSCPPLKDALLPFTHNYRGCDSFKAEIFLIVAAAALSRLSEYFRQYLVIFLHIVDIRVQ